MVSMLYVILLKRREIRTMSKKKAEEKIKGWRITRIDEEIRSGSYPNNEELAAKLEVNSRTIARDIDFLRDYYKAPLIYDPKKRGYYYTDPTFFVKSVFLSEKELETITLYDQFARIGTRKEDDLLVQFRKIIDKMLLTLPEDQTDSLLFLPTPENSLDFIFGGNIQIEGEINLQISNAIKNKEVIEIEYWIYDNKEYVKQEIEPLYKFFERHHYYVLAYENGNHVKPGVYSINRIRKANKTGKNFDIPDNFKISNYLKNPEDVARVDNKLYHFEFSFPKEVASEAIEKTYYHNQHIKLCEDGTVYLEFRSTQLDGIFEWVLKEGHKVKVLNPPELVNKIKWEAQKVVQYYTNNKDHSQRLINISKNNN